MRDRLCEWYGLDTSQVRVVTPDVGGGFGAKAFSYAEDMLLPWLPAHIDPLSLDAGVDLSMLLMIESLRQAITSRLLVLNIVTR